jgi:hypothetical protein
MVASAGHIGVAPILGLQGAEAKSAAGTFTKDVSVGLQGAEEKPHPVSAALLMSFLSR